MPNGTSPSLELPAATEAGALGVFHLKRAWARNRASRRGVVAPPSAAEGHRTHLVLDALGVGLEQTHTWLGANDPSFEAFEQWIVETSGGISAARIARINAAVAGTEPPAETRELLAGIDADPPALSDEDLAFWREHGYVILHDAVDPATRDAARDAVLAHVGADLANPETWGGNGPGIMVRRYQHPAFEANRRSRRVHKAYAQLWGTSDLWVTCDRAGFNPPETGNRSFQGPDLHWDMSLARPLTFHTQGVLYLTDTPAENGAFTCVPGFHRRIDKWLDELPSGDDPRRRDLHALGSKAIAGKAGDLVIWNDLLPHGASPNRGTAPRVVQYIAMYPANPEMREKWV